MKDKVSVVIPVYNAEKYLDRCLSSLINQTYVPLEIILVDDGSTDSSLSVCNSFAERDGRVKVIRKENAGAGLARNTGLDAASGKYVFFVDSDDFVDISVIEKCVDRMAEADAVFFGRSMVYDNGEVKKLPISSDKCFFEKGELSGLLSGLFTYERGIGISVWGKLLPLDVINNNSIRFHSEREVMSEDALFLMEVFSHLNSVSLLCENLYFYRQTGASLSKKINPRHRITANRFLETGVELCHRLGYDEEIISHFKARYLMYSLAGMKTAPTEELKKFFLDKTLLSALTPDVISLFDVKSRVFWHLFKKGLFGICYLLLKYKARG